MSFTCRSEQWYESAHSLRGRPKSCFEHPPPALQSLIDEVLELGVAQRTGPTKYGDQNIDVICDSRDRRGPLRAFVGTRQIALNLPPPTSKVADLLGDPPRHRRCTGNECNI